MFLNILFLEWPAITRFLPLSNKPLVLGFGMAEFPTVGKHCSVEFCKQLGIEKTFSLIYKFKISNYLPFDGGILFQILLREDYLP